MQKLSMGLSVFIALCIVSIFCSISIIIIESIDHPARSLTEKRINFQSDKELVDYVL